ncbi:MAG: peptidase M4 [Bacteroidetes bacterium]|nr:peptidase M4 [Bacteroidota bacterium]
MARWIRKAHRYLGLIGGLQLLAWALGGVYFSWNPIARVRGEHLAAPPESWSGPPRGLASPDQVLAAFYAARSDTPQVLVLTLRPLLGKPVYEIAYRDRGGKLRYALADAHTARLRPPIRREEALQIAQRDFLPQASVRRISWIERLPPGSEYRGKELPAWQVEFEHPTGTRLYVSAERGLVTARRNDTWRVFDFFWMLHIMDYRNRSDFNHWLLRVFSVLGLLTVLSGFVFGIATSPRLRRPLGRFRPLSARGR